jgi:hypothetical protein
VRVKPCKAVSSSTKRSKQRSKPANNVVYTCGYCSFENLKSGTPKSYVKEKLAEVVQSRSKPTKKSCKADALTPSSVPQTKGLTSLLETPGSTAKKSKRKGWSSLKNLAASSLNSPSLANKKPAPIEKLSQALGGSPHNPSKKRRKSMVSPSPLSLPSIIEGKSVVF